MIGQLQRLKEINRLGREIPGKIPNANIISFISGKGGTGKSTVSLNMAHDLSERGFKVLLVDMDLRMPNLHLMLNTNPENSIGDYFDNLCSFESIIEEITSGLFLILGSSGGNIMSIEEFRINTFLQKIENISTEFDFVLLDNPAGVNAEVQQSAIISTSSIIVATPEPTAVMDAYVMVKYLESIKSNKSIRTVINKSRNETEGQKAFNNLEQAVNYFLNSKIQLLGLTAYSDEAAKASIEQTFVKNISNKCDFLSDLGRLSTSILQNKHVANNSQASQSIS